MKKAKRTKRLIAKVVAAVCAVVVVLGAGSVAIQQPTPAGDLEVATVERVVDGDTLKVDLNGSQERVRLIGVNAPESVHPDKTKNTQEGATASDHVKSILSPGDTVWLQKDVSDVDQYDRLLRYVWLEVPTDANSEEEARAKMLNAVLVADGYADAKRYEPDVAYADLFEQLEADSGAAAA